jgi:hypothetical protein
LEHWAVSCSYSFVAQSLAPRHATVTRTVPLSGEQAALLIATTKTIPATAALTPLDASSTASR